MDSFEWVIEVSLKQVKTDLKVDMCIKGQDYENIPKKNCIPLSKYNLRLKRYAYRDDLYR